MAVRGVWRRALYLSVSRKSGRNAGTMYGISSKGVVNSIQISFLPKLFLPEKTFKIKLIFDSIPPGTPFDILGQG
jgi:hypothetical protein